MKYENLSWIVVLGVSMSMLVGCDGAPAPDRAELLADIEAGVIPLVAGDVAWVDAEPAAVPALGHGVPDGVYPKMHIGPTAALMEGWLQWALGQPYSTGPIADMTGERCADGQSGSVWFLAGTFGGPAVRECDIPAGKKLFFPLINRWCVFPSEYYPDEQSILDVLPWFAGFYDDRRAKTCELTLRVDGKDIRPDFAALEQDTYIVVNEPFELNLHDEHWAVGYFEGGPMPTTGAGHYVLLPPLPAGDHVIELGGKLCTAVPFETHVTYHLHIGP